MNGRAWFLTASTGLLSLLDGLAEEHLGRPGLGVWDVRALLGHTSRAYATIEVYLTPEPSAAPDLQGPADYFRAARTSGLADAAQVAERGRAAGEALGPHPVPTVRALAERVTRLVRDTALDATVTTPLGTMTLEGYLPTRAFELTLHGLDLARATGQDAPGALVDGVGPAIALCADLAGPDERTAMLLALTGREPLPTGFSVL